MARLYCPKELIFGERIDIHKPEQIHYIRDVLRLGVGDVIVVFDGEEHEYRCRITELSKKEAKLLIEKKIKAKVEPKLTLAVACALPKQKNRFDDLLDKLSQLGVDKIYPMITERVVVRWDYGQRQKHHRRWQKIAEQACAQSGRSALPVIEPVREMNQILSFAESYELKLIPTLLEKSRRLREAVCGSLPGSILVLVGPEGDFTKQELGQAESAGFIPVFLGDSVLRVDTAAIAVAAFIRLYENAVLWYRKV
ncbi:MAG: RsmE family RNA methyltransferase [Candidatus Omnitrophota bacterium]